jgi:selenoprotein W-related protein
LTDHLANKYKQRLESITLVPAGDGEFDIELDGELVYSKLDTGVFPDHAIITQAIDERL